MSEACSPVPGCWDDAFNRQRWRNRETPPVEEVLPGLWSIPVPMPGNPLRYVLSYGFETPAGVVVADPGWPAEESWQALVAGLAVFGARPEDVTGALITHLHPDHYGLAGRLQAISGCWVGAHRAEVEFQRSLPARGDRSALTRWYADCGVPDDIAASFCDDVDVFVRDSTPVDRTIDGGEQVAVPGWDVRAVWTPGHTGHLCFALPDHDTVLTGDHVLPGITPNVSINLGEGGDPVSTYLDSLSLVASLGNQRVLPAHEYRFRGLRDRAQATAEHHERRLEEMLTVLAQAPQPLTAWELASELTWSRPWDQICGPQRRFALSETLSHLRRLRQLGSAEVSERTPYRWRTSALLA